NPANVAEPIRSKLAGGKSFTTLIPQIGKDQSDLVRRLEQKNIQVEEVPEHGTWILNFIIVSLPFLLILGIFFLFILPRFRDPLGGSFLSNYIKSPARRYERSKMRVTFEDVADMQNAKSELQEVVDVLRSPEKFQRLG